ncbi:hypothetical protein CcaverHIS002_0208000 [Cutaneotrichosporon cavernicola]|uniref:Cytochrome b5 heme-binding domain-containing protein n=1 Tax=Cutaneotrichosporon cavernicola TaxID=279322 RepID=A0AA48L1S3_9TREE|nr:uncharacterized protein CcaverHIS019_0207990 [Cutaneotrichosporon cavernicola]BEI81640.1 hypothetical protein CcaverHIS002_0208000 [Cutaneotrichosporon cavernicola]BEI89437.1 hypothetical protein CcaverHIS019_0207990 [Cutaneotrichosporon cavernicola]BEI97211.1 hypothetical protein CcaverHIS631_0208000 [Cutaneotrichosporon cavernicola]BEJ04985.1 hypothetical protein CcaverHIS641_0208020 [Cutaneotrichosporon cavernicola]
MSDVKLFTYADLEEHKSRNSLWLTIHKKVYDVTAFLDEHPGGDEVLLEEAGRDGTEAFEDVGHSDEARDMLLKMYLGNLNPAEAAKNTTTANGKAQSGTPAPSAARFLMPIMVILAWWVYRQYFA